MHWEPSKTLASRSYVGLVLSQFLAAFNDQAIHFVAIFYASDMLVRYVHVPNVDHKLVLAVVTACFIRRSFSFRRSPASWPTSSASGRRSCFWKVAEVGITGSGAGGLLAAAYRRHWLGLAGDALPRSAP